MAELKPNSCNRQQMEITSRKNEGKWLLYKGEHGIPTDSHEGKRQQ